jgi:predicted nucleotidyltransferase
MNDQEQIVKEIIEAEPNLLYLVLSGSRVYGTNNSKSDYDYRGLFGNSMIEVIGMKKRDSQVYKSEDITLHGLHKFTKLAMDANPNVLELLFIDDFSIYTDPLFKKYFLDNRDMFLTQKCYYTYSGYAISQVKRSKHKSGHGILREKYIVGPDSDPYDSKYAMHTVRLMLNAQEILTKGTLHPHFEGEQLDFLKSIRTGEAFKTATDFYKYVEYMDTKLAGHRDEAKESKLILHHPDENAINQLLVDFYLEYFELNQTQ